LRVSREDDLGGLVVADLQRVRRNHTVKANLAGQTVEFVAVGVVAAIDIKVMFCDLFRRHVIIGVIGIFGVGSRGHSEECHCRDKEFCDCFHSLLLGLVDDYCSF